VLTPDADPRHLYRNVSVAIDSARSLYNGAPTFVASWIDHLGIRPGERILHVGSGMGYYTAVLAHCASETGHVLAFEVDEQLAALAQRNLARYSWVTVRPGDSSELGNERFDAILVSAGVTHPLDGWIRALQPGGRMVFPITLTMGVMGAHMGKGLVILASCQDDGSFGLQAIGMVMIYSAMGIRDASIHQRLTEVLMRGGGMTAKRLRLDRHPESSSCWLHLDRMCFSST
jgi:protein-L-isoaspartate(D-aspartate) O-methyltransferase